MATAPPLPLISVEEYLRSDFEPNAEYVDGVVVPKAMPDETHSNLSYALGLMLAPLRSTHRFRVQPERHIRITARRFRIPDISLIDPEAGAGYDVVPLVTIEIMSAGEPFRELHAKVRDHRLIGVPWSLAIDPAVKTVFVIGPDGLFHQLPSPAVARIPLPGRPELVIDFEGLFQEIAG